MPPLRFRKIIEDESEEETPIREEPLEGMEREQIKTEKVAKVGTKRKIVESSSDESSDDEMDERLELTDDVESFSSIDSQLEQEDEEMEEFPQYDKLLESKFTCHIKSYIHKVEKAILGKLESNSSNQQLIIHSIEMKNFKSYRHSTFVGPFTTGLNCIIGSNGSGKSNIIDSICFVLGFESKELRAKSLDYLINDQSSSDEESFVKINFNVINGRNDSSIKKFSIQRNIKRNDHTSSYYLLSPREETRRISRKQVRELLNEYGIDFDYPERFIVMQHNTIKMVKQNPLEMLFHLEKLFGTDRVQTEIKNVQEEITNLRSDIQSNEKEKSNCEKDLESLKPVVEIFQNFRRLEKKVEETKASIKDCELKCLLYKLGKNKEEVKRISSELLVLESDQANSKQEFKEINEEIERQEEKIESTEAETKEMKKNTSSVQKILLKLRLANDSHNQKVQHLESELERTSKESRQLTDQKNEIEISIFNTDTSIQNLEKSIASEEEDIKRLTATMDNTSQNLLLKLRRELQEVVESPQHASLISRTEKYNEIESKIDDLKRLLHEKEEEKKELQKLLDENSRLKDLEDLEIEILKSNLKKIQDLMDSKKKEKNLIEDEIIELETASLQREESSSLFVDTVRRIKSEVEGCFGTIPEIYRIIDQKYTVCVNSVFYPFLKNTVVVSRREVALKVVSFFEKNRSGLVSCEILNEIKYSPSDDVITPKELKPLIEVLECEPQYRQLLSKHANGWFITDSIEDAIKYSLYNGIRRNIVTLDGKVFKSFGEISCHFTKDCTFNQLSTQYAVLTTKEIGFCKDTEKLSNLKKKSQDLQVVFDQFSESLHDIKQQISEKELLSRKYQSSIKKLETSFSTLSRKMNAYRKDIENQKERLIPYILTPKEVATFEDIKKKRKELEMKITDIESIEDSGNSLFKLKQFSASKQKELVDLKYFKDTQRKKLIHITCLLSNLITQREKYSKDLDLCKTESNQEDLDLLESEYASLKKQKGKMESRKQDYCNRLKELKKNSKKVSQTINEKDQQISRKVHEKEVIQHENDELEVAVSKIASDTSKMKLDPKIDLELEEKRKLKLISELKHTSTEMENMQDNIDTDCLEKQSIAKKKLDIINRSLNRINHKIEHLEQLETKFLNLRYNLFHKVISKVNEILSQIFRELNNNSNCYISYYEDKKTLFEKGVNIYCKIDMEWKEFSKLSGGQKNLVCSVLSIALMRCFSTGICIFDELCSSLDTINVEKLAKLIKFSSNKTQFICISFKFYEKADTIIGVYHQNGISCTVPLSNK